MKGQRILGWGNRAGNASKKVETETFEKRYSYGRNDMHLDNRSRTIGGGDDRESVIITAQNALMRHIRKDFGLPIKAVSCKAINVADYREDVVVPDRQLIRNASISFDVDLETPFGSKRVTAEMKYEGGKNRPSNKCKVDEGEIDFTREAMIEYLDRTTAAKKYLLGMGSVDRNIKSESNSRQAMKKNAQTQTPLFDDKPYRKEQVDRDKIFSTIEDFMERTPAPGDDWKWTIESDGGSEEYYVTAHVPDMLIERVITEMGDAVYVDMSEDGRTFEIEVGLDGGSSKSIYIEPEYKYEDSVMTLPDDFGRGPFNPGDKVQISEGSGIDSGKTATVVSPREIKIDGRGVPTNIDGAYKPIDWDEQVAIRYDDGRYDTMYKDRLRKANATKAMKRSAGVWCPRCNSHAINNMLARTAGTCQSCGYNVNGLDTRRLANGVYEPIMRTAQADEDNKEDVPETTDLVSEMRQKLEDTKQNVADLEEYIRGLEENKESYDVELPNTSVDDMEPIVSPGQFGPSAKRSGVMRLACKEITIASLIKDGWSDKAIKGYLAHGLLSPGSNIDSMAMREAGLDNPSIRKAKWQPGSPIDPLFTAERIVAYTVAGYYHNAQEAYDQYMGSDTAQDMTTAQKDKVAELLSKYGFAIKKREGKDEEEADKEIDKDKKTDTKEAVRKPNLITRIAQRLTDKFNR